MEPQAGDEVSYTKQFPNNVELQNPLDCCVDAKGRRNAVDERDCGNQTADNIGGGGIAKHSNMHRKRIGCADGL